MACKLYQLLGIQQQTRGCAGRSSAGIHVCNCLHMKQGSAGKEHEAQRKNPINMGWQWAYSTTSNPQDTCINKTADVLFFTLCTRTVYMSLQWRHVPKHDSWEHLTSNTVWLYVTCVWCLYTARLRTGHVYKTQYVAEQHRPMICLHIPSLPTLHVTCWRHKKNISELQWSNMLPLHLSDRCTSPFGDDSMLYIWAFFHYSQCLLSSQTVYLC